MHFSERSLGYRQDMVLRLVMRKLGVWRSFSVCEAFSTLWTGKTGMGRPQHGAGYDACRNKAQYIQNDVSYGLCQWVNLGLRHMICMAGR